jgi:hypothetical protein
MTNPVIGPALEENRPIPRCKSLDRASFLTIIATYNGSGMNADSFLLPGAKKTRRHERAVQFLLLRPLTSD